MANLTTDFLRQKVDSGLTYGAPVAGATTAGTAHTIFKGDVVIAQAAQNGYCVGLKSGITFASGDVYLGLAEEQVVIGTADVVDGDKKVTVLQEGLVAFALGGLTIADLGSLVYATDSETLTLTAPNNVLVGSFARIHESMAFVKIDDYAGVALP